MDSLLWLAGLLYGSAALFLALVYLWSRIQIRRLERRHEHAGAWLDGAKFCDVSDCWCRYG